MSGADRAGDEAGVIWHPSPNFGPRRDGLIPQFVVLHYTAMETAEAALQRLCDPAAEVSAHYLIGQDGTLWQMVEEAQRAWHAGAGEWCGLEDLNSRSIGIELDNRGDHPFSEPQMTRLERLLGDILRRWEIASEGVIGHSDMAPGRKCDPGARFDWARLARQGLARQVAQADGQGQSLLQPESADMARFRAYARDVGYTAPVEDETLLAAVRLRYRPQARGPLCAADFVPLGQAELWG
ncbi:N-acetylmuramoyl-L-alanine amidase [Phaeobacter gallaeciensis]|uniref:N-acetylmuramoyl-L-alanine amidase n=1 Tax=Phaeobacter gallaeciensis TaxID=60890 RepID=UPI00237F7D5B|nr:N-acetylmuramoyl-L-alanine amidase [Phaeobacter gallaeciensis]MDE4098789.1 N-acetylmuramoyl-L-alanine amidase [Phaeobacter gallaeciensis]MDE4107454.1 N-acetylmuramoyl-L-alanine amidase [Phaeobacter gallaeciensis]MDE4111908.1 N-acetylmuramoyl-L-alanine amidase [Phaeobacter gallaeciensis]MDE4116524.1 N-acetylmuramoyl-L-alanine amidase [Phaeobacter gallaeciensis]MDE4120995.1 N-acetylmuramoyl-L-alanine amidase [Phaeobacter gallaeciensis]